MLRSRDCCSRDRTPPKGGECIKFASAHRAPCVEYRAGSSSTWCCYVRQFPRYMCVNAARVQHVLCRIMCPPRRLRRQMKLDGAHTRLTRAHDVVLGAMFVPPTQAVLRSTLIGCDRGRVNSQYRPQAVSMVHIRMRMQHNMSRGQSFAQTSATAGSSSVSIAYIGDLLAPLR